MIAMNRLKPRFSLSILVILCVGLALPAYAQPSNGKNNGNNNGSTPPWGIQATQPTVPTQPSPAAAAETAPAAADTLADTGKAQTVAAPTLSDLGRSLRNYFTEDELTLLFQYMKETVIASFKDEEVNLPPDLAFKLEILLVRMKRESDHYMDNLISQLENDLKNSLQEKLKNTLTPPPIKEEPYNPWLTAPWK